MGILQTPKILKKISDIETDLGDRANQLNLSSKISSNKTIHVTEDIYLTTKISLNNVSNLTVKSLNGKTKISCTQDQVFYLNNCSNIVFENIIFESTFGTEYGYGAIFISTASDNITFRNCIFTTLGSNGVKIVAETADKYVKNIYFDNCIFDTIGRMGIETQNHSALGYATIEGIYISNCRFYNVGNVAYPMMISFSGMCKNMNVKNCYFDGTAGISGTIGIEGVAMSESTIDGNYFKGAFDWTSFTNTTLMYNNKITNNCTHESYSGRFYAINQRNLIISNNSIRNGYIYLTSSNESLITNNQINSIGTYCIILDNCLSNSVTNNLVINTTANNWALIRCYGAGSMYNTMSFTRYSYASSGSIIDLSNSGATNNYSYFTINDNTGIVYSIEFGYIKRTTKAFSTNVATFTATLDTAGSWTNTSFNIDTFIFMGSGVQNGAKFRVKGVLNLNYNSNTGLYVAYSDDNTLSGLTITAQKVSNTSFSITVTDATGTNYVNCLSKIEDIGATGKLLSYT